MIPIDTAVPMIAQQLFEQYGDEASSIIACRTRLLETCGDRHTAKCWELVREAIEVLANDPRIRVRRMILDHADEAEVFAFDDLDGRDVPPQPSDMGDDTTLVA